MNIERPRAPCEHVVCPNAAVAIQLPALEQVGLQEHAEVGEHDFLDRRGETKAGDGPAPSNMQYLSSKPNVSSVRVYAELSSGQPRPKPTSSPQVCPSTKGSSAAAGPGQRRHPRATPAANQPLECMTETTAILVPSENRSDSTSPTRRSMARTARPVPSVHTDSSVARSSRECDGHAPHRVNRGQFLSCLGMAHRLHTPTACHCTEVAP